MGLNFKLIQRTSKTSTSDIVHSSGYAAAENAGRFGSADNTTFSQRQQIEQKRKLIQGYRNAKVAQGVNMMPKAMTYDEEIAMRAKMNAIAEGEKNAEDGRREFNLNREEGGLRRFDTRNRSSFGQRQPDMSSLSRREQAAVVRAERAQRFEGHAHPIPKSGGFGRH